jgi:NADPH:quinone reductase-like Zn-dependent oxidoreductase
MKAITKYRYGGPEILQLEEVDKPTLKPGHLLISVKANSVNPADWHILRGEPFLVRLSMGLSKPKNKILGADFTGIVEDVGEGVTKFKKGDRVFGEMNGNGAFAEYTCAPENVCGHMPDSSSYTAMACVPIAGLTALQALVTHGQLKAGESVLINGSSGGVGHFAVQIARAYGATVTAICSSRNLEFVKSLGADLVIAHDKEDVHKLQGDYDLVLDTHGNLNFSDFRRLGRSGVLVGMTSFGHMMSVVIRSLFSRFSLKLFTAEASYKDLNTLSELIGAGQVTPSIEKTYPASEVAAAIEYIEKMSTRGKVAISWE